MKDFTSLSHEELERMLLDRPRAIGGTPTSLQYVAVPLECLVPGGPLGFQVFLKVDNRYVLIQGRDERFDVVKRDHLLALQQATVFIQVQDQPRYHEHVEANLRRIVRDSGLNETEKAKIVYDSIQVVVRDLLKNPLDPRLPQRAQEASEAAVDFVLSGRKSFLSFLTGCSLDYQTYSHSVHVSMYAIGLGHRLGWPPELLSEMGAGVLIHDVGKTRVDEKILTKPGPLTEAEWDVMRRHPRWGLELVERSDGVTALMKDIVLHHHEKLDGSGYPDRLRGEQISPAVRAVTICDIFDAVTSHRPYKKALPSFDALKQIQSDMRGKIDFQLLTQFILLLQGEP